MPCPKKKRKHTPIVSKAQRGAMGVAYAAKRGKIPKSKLKGPAREMAKSMPKAELKRHLKESKGKKLPQKVAKKRRSRKIIGSAYKFAGNPAMERTERIRTEAGKLRARAGELREEARARAGEFREEARTRAGEFREEARTRAGEFRTKAEARRTKLRERVAGMKGLIRQKIKEL